MAKKKNLSQEGRGYEVFQAFNNLFFLLVLFVTAYPIYYVLIASFSSPSGLVVNYGVIWLPIKPYTVEAYSRVLHNSQVLTGYKNTLLILAGGLTVNLIMTALGAYFLSLKDVMLSKPIGMLILFTMYFSGGMIPGYLNIRELGLLDTLWALFIPGAISTYNMLILRTAFVSIPASLEECAMLDGAGDVTILFRIILPLSVASFAVVGMYYAVDHWNSWFSAMIYLDDRRKYPLQLILREILITGDLQTMSNAEELIDATSDSTYNAYKVVKYCSIVVATVPILVIYPFVQRYFVKGVMVGSVKG